MCHPWSWPDCRPVDQNAQLVVTHLVVGLRKLDLSPRWLATIKDVKESIYVDFCKRIFRNFAVDRENATDYEMIYYLTTFNHLSWVVSMRCRRCRRNCYWSVYMWSCIVVRHHCCDMHSLVCSVHNISTVYTPCLKKLCKSVFFQNFVTSTNFDIFCRKMAKRLKLCEMHSFSTSPNLRHHITMLNADVPNCYKKL